MSLLSAPLVAMPLLATGTAHATPVISAISVPPPPTPPVALPADIDVAPSYQQQNTCDPTAKPGVVDFAKMLNQHYGTRHYGISRNCNSGITEHSEGRALDWMISAYDPQQKAIADAVVQWLSASDDKGNPGVMARRFGINYIIWNRKMWRAYAPERGWATYTGSHPHDDHIHITFTWDGAYKRTSWWTGVALKTVTIGPGSGVPGAADPGTVPIMTSTGYHVLRTGSTGEEVQILQRALKITVDGSFGPQTEAAVRVFQTDHRLTVDGVVGPQSWTKLIELGLVPPRNSSTPAAPAAHPLEQYASQTLRRGSTGAAVTALQRALSITADGSFGPATETRVKAYQVSKELTADGVVNANVWNALMDKAYTKTAPAAPAAHPLEQYASQTLRRGSTGAAVTALQRALSITADGSFGPATETRVKAYQASKELTADGVVNANVWNALMDKAYTKTAPAAPAAHPLEQYASQTLRRGSTGAAVTALQRALSITADGSFGPATETRVKAYQVSKELTADGVVNANVWNALMDRAYTKTAPATPAPPAAHPLEQYASQTLRRGSTGAAVTALQRALGGLAVDGSFGPATEARVREYQRSKDLTATGVVTAEVWNALMGR